MTHYTVSIGDISVNTHDMGNCRQVKVSQETTTSTSVVTYCVAAVWSVDVKGADHVNSI